jgi:hypothetical protein
MSHCILTIHRCRQRIDGWAKREKIGQRSKAVRARIEKGLEK